MRFGLICDADDADPVAVARRAEVDGYDTVLFPDHLGLAAPMVAAAAAAVATDHIHLGTLVLNNDFRNPTVLADEVRTLQRLGAGRVEVGLGAGWAREEYEQAGIAFDPPTRRIMRLDRTLSLLRRRLADQPVPLLVGGNGDRLLTVAARRADIVSLTGFSFRAGKADLTHFSFDGLADRIGVLRTAAGDRFDAIELSVLVQHAAVTERAADEVAGLPMVQRGTIGVEDALASPFLLVGSVQDITDKVAQLRELGVTYVTVFDGRSAGFAAVVDTHR